MPRNLNITFSHENAEQTVMIGIVDDIYLEPNEMFNCTLSLVTPNNPSIQLSPDVATVTIINDDRKLVNKGNSYFNCGFSIKFMKLAESVLYVIDFSHRFLNTNYI